MLSVKIGDQYRDVVTVAEYAEKRDIKPSTMAQRVKKYSEKSVLIPAHKAGNMVFFLIEDLDVVNNTMAREPKPKRPTVEQWEEAMARIDELVKQRDEMAERVRLLDALEAAGVDNWEGYDEACRIYNGEDDNQ